MDMQEVGHMLLLNKNTMKIAVCTHCCSYSIYRVQNFLRSVGILYFEIQSYIF